MAAVNAVDYSRYASLIVLIVDRAFTGLNKLWARTEVLTTNQLLTSGSVGSATPGATGGNCRMGSDARFFLSLK
ncbi:MULTISPECIES: hypothetical protein [unclassified Microcoleus]|uniref:hypothetical protein n=1 Tax=unclassified Microcoleus TaxID=2642155 RepID=UPI002FD6FEC0